LKVLLIIDHAPDYREAFFRELGENVDLTVAAQPCRAAGLAPPERRAGYRYIEVPARQFKGFYWQPGLKKLLYKENWDVVCFDINLRQLARLFLFVTNRKWWARWVWRGHVFGKNSSGLLDALRKFMLKHGAACLAYSELIARHVFDRYGIEAVSFNNTQVSKEEFRGGKFNEHPGLRLLFVGRNQPRKNLDRLIHLAKQRPDIRIRLIGPEMKKLNVPEELTHSGRIEIVGRTVGNELNPHFDWADLVVNPGHVGLLVMNAAKHGKGIVVDSGSEHAPEYWLAKEAGQPFISFGDMQEVNRFIDDVLVNRWKLQHWGRQLQDMAKEKYTIEYMAEAHLRVFEKVAKTGRHDYCR
jgi:glycosyltransferase involved in cell wall biosynthesis